MLSTRFSRRPYQGPRRLGCYVLLFLAASSATAQTVEHLYSPGTNLERSELAQLETEARTMDVAMDSLTDPYLAEELAALARKGVHVRVYRAANSLGRKLTGAVPRRRASCS